MPDLRIFAALNHTNNISLKKYNTFGLDVACETILEFSSEEELIQALRNVHLTGEKFMILGGGSNVLFTRDFEGIILLNRIKGIAVVEEHDEEVIVESGGGETWHDLVLYCVEKGWGGIENLSLIPGRVGAAPIQNIGAYGVELKDVFDSLSAIEISTGEKRIFHRSECQFGYRDSIFKKEKKGQYVITSVRIRLKRNAEVNTSYGAIGGVLRENNISNPTIRDVSNAVIEIRRSKLPDPAILGNSGSFFKNPVITRIAYQLLQNDHPEIPSYNVDDDHVKVPAGWLIEQCGFKGKRYGETGCHEKQALVIVNYGHATGSEIKEHAMRIISEVNKKFGIRLEPEVNIIE